MSGAGQVAAIRSPLAGDRLLVRRPRVAVIGGGISGLTSAYRLTRLRPEIEVIVLERDRRLGGKVVTERRDGFVIEGGPEAMVAAKPQAAALCRELGLADRLVAPTPTARRTYVRRNGRLHPLPEGLGGFMPRRFGPIARSSLVSPLGKARMALEVVVPPRRSADDESVAAFFERRLGREAYRWLVDPLLGAIYAGDGHRLSLAAILPHVQQLERDHGGLLRGALAARRAGSPPPTPNPAPFLAPRGGMGEVIDALAEHLRAAGVQIITGAAVTAITEAAGGYRLASTGGRSCSADAVVCAAPAPASAALVSDLDPALAAVLRAVPHASVATVSLAYPLGAFARPLDASGYVTSRGEGRPVHACTWVSAKWADRSPPDAGLVRVSLGGAGAAHLLDASDDSLISLARQEVGDLFGIDASPALVSLFRWPEAIPQYEPGHLDRVAAIDSRLDTHHPGLALAGNAYRGVGLSDCVASGERAAARVAAFLAGTGHPASGENAEA